MPAVAEKQPRRKLWSRDEGRFLLNAGLLGQRPFELLDGEIVYKIPKNPPHVSAVRRCARWAEGLFGAMFVRTQDPLILDLFNEPEPDILVTFGPEEDYGELHPTAAEARLVIEVSDATRNEDLEAKARRYARAGVAEYWVLDLEHRCLYVHQEPSESGFGSILRLAEDQRVVSPAVAVSDLLPPR
jgi:Uma2 family endonuclease